MIKRSSMFFIIWNLLNTVTCIVSAFQYAFMTAFGTPQKGTKAYIFDSFFEAVFICDALLQFFLEYQDQNTRTAVRDHYKIAMFYFKGRCAFDCLTIIPFKDIFNSYERSRLFYSVKILRLKKGFYLLDTSKFKEQVKVFFDKRLKKYIKSLEQQPNLVENMYLDKTLINTQLYIIYVFRTVKLIIFILGSSYFIGMFWYIICDLNRIAKHKHE